MRFTLATTLALLAAVCLLSSASVSASAATGHVPADHPPSDPSQPDPSEVYITALTYGGSGCPQGTVNAVISADRQSFALSFASFAAAVGPGVPISASRRNCQAIVSMHYPQGYQYSVLTAVYRGYVQMDAGVRGLHKSTYYFSGERDQVSTTAPFVGPVEKDYEVVDRVAQGSEIWSPCGGVRALNINSQVRLAAGGVGQQGQMTQDRQEGTFTQVVGFRWRQC